MAVCGATRTFPLPDEGEPICTPIVILEAPLSWRISPSNSFNRSLATSVLILTSRPFSNVTRAALIFPTALVMRFCVSIIVLTDAAALFSISAFRLSDNFLSKRVLAFDFIFLVSNGACPALITRLIPLESSPISVSKVFTRPSFSSVPDVLISIL